MLHNKTISWFLVERQPFPVIIFSNENYCESFVTFEIIQTELSSKKKKKKKTVLTRFNPAQLALDLWRPCIGLLMNLAERCQECSTK